MNRIFLLFPVVVTSLFLAACSTQTGGSSHVQTETRPFPLDAYLIGAQNLPKGKTSYWEETPVAHNVPVLPNLAPSKRQGLFGAKTASTPATRTVVPKNPTGPIKIIVDLNEQKSYYFQGDWLRGVTRISSGMKNFPTPAGSYKVTQKSANHRSNLYGKVTDATGTVTVSDADSRKHAVPEGGSFVGASMPNFMRLQDAENKIHGVGFHAGRLPGYRASHGCIRLPSQVASTYFRNTPAGTQVEVLPSYPVPLEAEVALGRVTPEEAQAKLAPVIASR